MSAQIPESSHKRIIIIGAGFGGLKLARKLIKRYYQVVLLDRQNFHQFQPLFYQVATAGLAPSAISFPIRTLFHQAPNVHFRVAEVTKINPEQNTINTSIGSISYDYLVIATGADTNFFGNESVKRHALPMKTTGESLQIRNHVLQCIEKALTAETDQEREALLNIVIVGAGPTGVELAGAFAEMKRYILPKDYPEIDFDQMKIYLVEAGPRILGTMSEKSSTASEQFLSELGVISMTNTLVTDYDGQKVNMKGKTSILTNSMIWAAGVVGNIVSGISDNDIEKGRFRVDRHCKLVSQSNIYAIGDIALMQEDGFEHGHPQVAQVAMQQADLLAMNFKRMLTKKPPKQFGYKDLGSMATIGRSKAVADLPRVHFNGFFAWLFWLFVHLMNILGVKNKLFIFIDWMWYYISFSQSLRLVIKQKSSEN